MLRAATRLAEHGRFTGITAFEQPSMFPAFPAFPAFGLPAAL